MALAGYRKLVGHPGCFLRLAGPWVVLGAAVAALDLASLWAAIAALLLPMLMWAVISVSWCRQVLLNDTCAYAGRLGRRELRYFAIGLLLLAPALFLVCGVAVAAWALAPGDPLSSPWFQWSATEAVLLAYLAVASRLQLIFPAIAVGDSAVTLRSSVRLTRGAGLAIFLGSVIAAVPLLVPAFSWYLPDDAPQALASGISNGVDYLATTVSAVVMAGFSAQLYRRQVGGPAAVSA